MIYAVFDTLGIIDATTQGGPGKDNAILVFKVNFDGFKTMDISGAAVVLMVIVIALTVLKFRFIEKKVSV